MNKICKGIQIFHEIDRGKREKESIQKIHPLARLIVTITFVCITVSFPKYQLLNLSSMILYILLYNIWYDISFVKAVKRTWPVLLVTCIVGIANPIVEREVIFYIGGLGITSGMLSMSSLMLKGMLCVLASYSLVMTIGINGICYGLNAIHVPQIITTGFMLTYRYIIVLLKEVERMWQSYKLRAPYHKGIHFKAWGSFAGQLLLRSIDRGERVYESMLLRRYEGNFFIRNGSVSKVSSVIFAVVWCALFLILRFVPVFKIVGSFIV